MKRFILFIAALILVIPWLGLMGLATANMATYTAEPVFTSRSVAPNVMIILDNSGSMNFNAYGSYPGEGGTVNDEPFAGEGYSTVRSFPVVSTSDDMEETVSNGQVRNDNSEKDLDMGESLVGIRFQNVLIPQGVTITSASIGFIADENGSDASTLTIDAQASDNAPALNTSNYNISGRTGTTATVAWSPQAWTSGNNYSTDDITAIVQEIVSRPGWNSGNAMLFRINGTGKRASESRESGSQYAPVLRIAYDDGGAGKTRYYGYFSPDYFYSYSNNAFRYAYKKVSFTSSTGTWNVQNLSGASSTLTGANIVSQALWDGNWLNWLCMRRIDVLRKVLFGGDTHNGRDGTGIQMLYGENNGDRYFYKTFNSGTCVVSPYLGNYSYRVRYDYITVNNTNYYIHVEKKQSIEPSDFFYYGNGNNLSGVLQKIGDQNVRWGNIWFRLGTGSGNSGGYVDRVMGTDMMTLVSALESKDPDTWTPLAETMYVAMQYFRQEQPAGSLDYYSAAIPNAVKGDSDDPYYQNGFPARCAKSFVLMLTDGASTKDAKIPSSLKNYSGDGDHTNCDESTNANCDYPDGGTDFLDDVTLYAHTVDLRSDLADSQTLTFYAVYAFGNDQNARNLLQSAAKNGGFEDKNHNGRPDDGEWDEDGDGIPDTYFEASDGYALEARLMEAFGDIQQQAASGTSASVLATNSEGEGNVLQAYFMAFKESQDRTENVRWIGFLQSLWVDGLGQLRDDSGSTPLTLDDDDKLVTFTTDDQGNTSVSYNGGASQPLDTLYPIFEAGKRLSDRSPATRDIFTFVDRNRDGLADDPSNNPLDQSGELVAFNTSSAALIKPYLGVLDDTTYGDLGLKLGTTVSDRVTNIIEWVRGTEVTGLRNRTVEGVTYRLGDIIDSTPVAVSRPPDDFHNIYADKSYLDYWVKYKDRETMIYVGANDGMLHAFTGWKYTLDDQGRPTYAKPDEAKSGEQIGDEAWAFIPQALLPHLKWLAHKDYTHTYMVDGRPRVFDAKILPDDTHYKDDDSDNNWGTFLVMGLRMGGKHISVTEDFGSGVETRDFDPVYFCLDITDPRHPRLMWERTYPGLAMSWARPAPLKVGDDWYLAFGSGPTDYNGTSSQPAYLYIADILTGRMLRRFGPIENANSKGFMNDSTTFDKNMNYNVDAIYTTGDFLNNGVWQGGVYKIAIPCTNCQWSSNYNASNDMGYATDPNSWVYSKLYASDLPITTPVSVSIEVVPANKVDNVWLYFGTGRYLVKTDILNSDQQYLVGIKDPFFNSRSSVYHSYSAATTTDPLELGNLLRADNISVTTGNHYAINGAVQNVSENGNTRLATILDLEKDIQDHYAGWYRQLDDFSTGPSQRIVSKASILGGMVFVPTFTPDTDLCNYGGTTNVLAVYYATGTGYYRQILSCPHPTTITVNGKQEQIVAVSLPVGFTGSPPPAAGMHAGQEKGAKAFMQQSSGQIIQLDVVPPFYFQGAIIDWWD
ncbi:MAG: PilC/PilY family type IV pilus protein [Desulfobacteraceae bacterium]|nr:PilC/PilY family type IV pilus protein [Desulfobacteraceae bacterium]